MRERLSTPYLAGLFDGEGSIGVYRNGQGRFHLRTQLTQNCTPVTQDLLTAICATYGGNLAKMRSAIYSGGVAFNWQLNGNGAATFLNQLLPHLRLKRDQAELAIAWQMQHVPPGRDALGRMIARLPGPFDARVESVLKRMKSGDPAVFADAHRDGLELLLALRQMVCVKG